MEKETKGLVKQQLDYSKMTDPQELRELWFTIPGLEEKKKIRRRMYELKNQRILQETGGGPSEVISSRYGRQHQAQNAESENKENVTCEPQHRLRKSSTTFASGDERARSDISFSQPEGDIAELGNTSKIRKENIFQLLPSIEKKPKHETYQLLPLEANIPLAKISSSDEPDYSSSYTVFLDKRRRCSLVQQEFSLEHSLYIAKVNSSLESRHQVSENSSSVNGDGNRTDIRKGEDIASRKNRGQVADNKERNVGSTRKKQNLNQIGDTSDLTGNDQKTNFVELNKVTGENQSVSLTITLKNNQFFVEKDLGVTESSDAGENGASVGNKVTNYISRTEDDVSSTSNEQNYPKDGKINLLVDALKNRSDCKVRLKSLNTKREELSTLDPSYSRESSSTRTERTVPSNLNKHTSVVVSATTDNWLPISCDGGTEQLDNIIQHAGVDKNSVVVSGLDPKHITIGNSHEVQLTRHSNALRFSSTIRSESQNINSEYQSINYISNPTKLQTQEIKSICGKRERSEMKNEHFGSKNQLLLPTSREREVASKSETFDEIILSESLKKSPNKTAHLDIQQNVQHYPVGSLKIKNPTEAHSGGSSSKVGELSKKFLKASSTTNEPFPTPNYPNKRVLVTNKVIGLAKKFEHGHNKSTVLDTENHRPAFTDKKNQETKVRQEFSISIGGRSNTPFSHGKNISQKVKKTELIFKPTLRVEETKCLGSFKVTLAENHRGNVAPSGYSSRGNSLEKGVKTRDSYKSVTDGLENVNGQCKGSNEKKAKDTIVERCLQRLGARRESVEREKKQSKYSKDINKNEECKVRRESQSSTNMEDNSRVVSGVDLDSVDDETFLYQLLDITEDFDQRKIIRSRLREVQAVSRAKRDEMMKKREQEREDAIKQRQREAAEQKQRTLAMYDSMAKSAPAGGPKQMDINIYKEGKPGLNNDNPPIGGGLQRDLVEESIRERQKEADERKRRILSSYDAAAKSGPAGTIRDVNFETSKKIGANQNKVSARAKFQQMDEAVTKQQGNKTPNPFVLPLPVIRQNASQIKQTILEFCQRCTQEYKNIDIQNFSTSWSDGLAFCALIHHFYPDSFDFDSLNPKNRRYNFDLGFRTAEEKAGIAPLLDVEDMVLMKKPDWKCVFTYVQSFYRRFRDQV
ncbi:uncharacterized protein LOC143253909 isoform X3 [Tachypleus tridentatus]|uniref:uncharacterized protein LOC143253909 isoform X3 n=1 Tax=Tachypleus tridentatus TaxID=6853 RepID=UPI003FCF09FE